MRSHIITVLVTVLVTIIFICLVAGLAWWWTIDADSARFFNLTHSLVALLLAVGSIAYAIYTARQDHKSRTLLNVQIGDLKKITNEIADCTRTHVSGIEEVLYRMFIMFRGYRKAAAEAPPGKKYEIWFLGFTLGLGAMHNVKPVIDNWQEKHKGFTQEPCNNDFSIFIDELHEALGHCISEAGQEAYFYCLDHDGTGDASRNIISCFVDPLRQRYRPERQEEANWQQNIDLMKKLHSSLQNKFSGNNKESGSVNTSSNVPLQVIVTTIMKKNQEIRQAVLVFNIGALNAATNEVAGFYSESEYLCTMFKDYIKNINKSSEDSI